MLGGDPGLEPLWWLIWRDGPARDGLRVDPAGVRVIVASRPKSADRFGAGEVTLGVLDGEPESESFQGLIVRDADRGEPVESRNGRKSFDRSDTGEVALELLDGDPGKEPFQGLLARDEDPSEIGSTWERVRSKNGRKLVDGCDTGDVRVYFDGDPGKDSFKGLIELAPILEAEAMEVEAAEAPISSWDRSAASDSVNGSTITSGVSVESALKPLEGSVF